MHRQCDQHCQDGGRPEQQRHDNCLSLKRELHLMCRREISSKKTKLLFSGLPLALVYRKLKELPAAANA